MSIRFSYLSRFILLSVVIAVAGCSWPAVKIGDDKYLLGPVPTKETTKDSSLREAPGK